MFGLCKYSSGISCVTPISNAFVLDYLLFSGAVGKELGDRLSSKK
jgi:hypothetical protein